MTRSFAFAASLLALVAAAPAIAADMTTYDAPAEAPVVESGTDLIIELGVGGRLQPEYEGASDYEVSPFPIISLGYLNIPGVLELGSTSPQGGGLHIGPSFDYIGERDASDHDALEGLDDVDATYAAGVKLGYEWEYAEVYGAVRYAFGGADGVMGEVGANLIARPTAELQLKAGPVVSFASEDYMDTYFGVSAAESVSTGGRLGAYDPDGGFKSAGVAASARYEFRTDWFLNADASWTSMIGDAKDSPIVEAGDQDQYTFGLGISKRFNLDLF